MPKALYFERGLLYTIVYFLVDQGLRLSCYGSDGGLAFKEKI
jgi:hypothetical protein